MTWTNSSGNKNWLNSNHNWQNDGGYVNMFAYEFGHYCNGPSCKDCGFTGCWHCKTDCPPCPKNPITGENNGQTTR